MPTMGQMLTAERISALLADQSSPGMEPRIFSFRFAQPPRPAAVLIAFQSDNRENGDFQIVYTRRTDIVPDHKSQVAFPGGRAEIQDKNPIETALRESYEEIGLKPEDVTVLGALDSILTISNYLVTPIVGIIPSNYTFKPEPKEVDRVFTIPLSWLAMRENFETRLREVNPPLLEKPDVLRVIYFKPFDGETLWGVSAEITLRLLYKLRLLE